MPNGTCVMRLVCCAMNARTCGSRRAIRVTTPAYLLGRRGSTVNSRSAVERGWARCFRSAVLCKRVMMVSSTGSFDDSCGGRGADGILEGRGPRPGTALVGRRDGAGIPADAHQRGNAVRQQPGAVDVALLGLGVQ